MSKDEGVSKRGRPPLDNSIKRKVVELFKSEGGDRSLRWLARQTGISSVSVRRILEKEGLWERRRGSVPSPGKRVPQDQGTGNIVNLTQVAEAAGVSKSTVSLALNQSPKIREETRQRINKLAREMGYRAHPYIGAHMASVRAGRVKFVQESIAYVYANPDGVDWATSCKQPWGPKRKFEAASQAAFEKGYSLKPQYLFEFGQNARRLEDVLHNRGVRGLLLDFPAYFSAMAGLNLGHFSSVAFRDQNPITLHVVGHDMFRSVLMAYGRLWELGYRRIGFITSDAVSTSSLFVRDAAYRHAQYHLTPKEDHLPILHADTLGKHYRDSLYYGDQPQEINRCGEADWLMNEDWSALKAQIDAGDPLMQSIHDAILSRWLREHRPDAIICEHGDMLGWLENLGYRVPADMGVVHCNLNTDVPGWSGIRRADELVAAHAIDLLLQKIDHGETGQPRFPIIQRSPGNWVEGSTSPKVNQPNTPLTRYAREWVAKVADHSIAQS